MKYCCASNPVSNPRTPVPLSGDFCLQMEKAKAMGYHAIEIHVPDVAMIDIPALRNAMERTGMEVATLGTGTIYGKYGLHLCDENESNQNRLYEMVCRFIDCAAELSSGVTIGSIKGSISAGADREKHLHILGCALRRIDDYAGEKGVIILLEATNRYENNVLNNAAELAGMIHSYELRNTRALLDVFHMNIEEAKGAAVLEDAADVLGHIHIADNNRRYPGAGCYDFEVLRDVIHRVGYDGMLSVECLPWPNGDEAAAQAGAFLHRMFD